MSPSSPSPATTATYKALGATQPGSSHQDVLSFHDIPKMVDRTTLSPTDVLIRVAYAEINPVDLQKLKRRRAPDDSLLIPGYGGSGVVYATGSSTDVVPHNLKEQQRVAFLADPNRPGSYAEYIIVDYRCVTVLPPTVSFRDAATCPLAGCTAHEALEKMGLLSGPTKATTMTVPHKKRFLIVGAAGGVGSWAMLLARSQWPDDGSLEIIATASTNASKAWCTQLGATNLLDHDNIQCLGGGPKGSVDYILCLTEPTKPIFAAMSEVIKPYGSICLVVGGTAIQSLDVGFCFFKSVTIFTETVFSALRDNYKNDNVPSQRIATIVSLLERRQFKAPVSPQLEAEDWRVALQESGLLDQVASGHTQGKLVMKVTEGEGTNGS